jgi:DNA invertase Pin-like site-specific DNA recombinase
MHEERGGHEGVTATYCPASIPCGTVLPMADTYRVRAYARISVARDESQALDQQQHLIERWRDYKHPGAEIEWYEDEGISGAKATRLKERAKLLTDLRPGDFLTVTKIDRLARNLRDLLDIVKHCEDVGATLVVTEQQIDTSGPYGKFTLHLLGAIAELEREVVGERVQAARQQFRRDGRYGMERLPWGFKGDRQHNGWLAVRPDPDKAPKILESVRAIIGGASQAGQARQLGIDARHLSYLLHNPRLYGQQPNGKHDPDAAIISMMEWRQLQTCLAGPKSWSKAPGYGAAMECYECGQRLYLFRPGTMEKKRKTPKSDYRCESKHPQRPSISRRIADAFLESEFLSRYGQAPVVEALYSSDDKERQERLAALDIELDAATASLRAKPDSAVWEAFQHLHAEREAIQAEPARDTITYHDTGATVADLFAEGSDAERVVMLNEYLRVVVHPRDREAGRFELSELKPAAEPYRLTVRAWEPVATTADPFAVEVE